MSPEEVFTGVALIAGIAVACQVLAPRIRVPALLLLLPAGFLAGNLFDSVDPLAIFGDSFTSLVNIAVALILFHGGMELFTAPTIGKDHRIVRRLLTVGALITWAGAALAAHLFLGLPGPVALLFGAILIVSGPTVVGPLLEFARPQSRIRRILMWEGTLIDPVGALIAVIFFQGLRAADEAEVARGAARFAVSVGVGVTAAAVGLALIWVGLWLAGSNRLLGTQVLFGAVIVAAGFASAIAEDSGLLAAVLMGLATPLLVRRRLEDHFTSVMPFFDVLVGISISVLFVAISALVTPQSLRGLVLPCMAIVAVLVLVVRPATALLLTYRSGLSLNDRLFIGWMAPKGIVAAATAAGFSATLIDTGTEGARELLPATFLIIAGTVAVYSVTATPMAKLLGVRSAEVA